MNFISPSLPVLVFIHCPWSKGALKNCHLLLSLSVMNTVFHAGWSCSQVRPRALQGWGPGLAGSWACPWRHVGPVCILGPADSAMPRGSIVSLRAEGVTVDLSCPFPSSGVSLFLHHADLYKHTECWVAESGPGMPVVVILRGSSCSEQLTVVPQNGYSIS